MTDPHADIQHLCDALATAMQMLEREGYETPSHWAPTLSKRIFGMPDDTDVFALFDSAVTVMARNRVTH